MLSPYGLDLVENCITCKQRPQREFCNLDGASIERLEALKFASSYPKGAVLFVEGQSPRGVYILCRGRVKLSFGAEDGRTIILKIVEPGEVLGLSATISGKPYELTAETLDPCQVNFIRREDFLKFMRERGDVCLKVAEQLSEKYNKACHEVRSLGLSHSAGEKLARLLVEWSERNGEDAKAEPRIMVALTHEEIAQMIGTSRETVTRTLADFRRKQIIQSKGAALTIRNKAALRAMAGQ